MAPTIIEDLFSANDWAARRLFQLCEGLSDDQLDSPREMGFGSLRGTLFHVLMAETIWLERWQGVPWRQLPTEPNGIPIAEIAATMQQVARERQQLLDSERPTGWQRIVTYRNRQGTEARKPLCELLMHVANHGMHHRAQLLNYLKGFGRTVPVGLDYLFYRLARPCVIQDEATVAALRAYGIEIHSAPGVEIAWDADRVQRYFAYHDWATARVLESAASLDDAALDRQFDLGPGSIRKTLVHLYNVEPMWLKVWREGSAAFTPSDASYTIADLQTSWSRVAQERNDFLDRLDEPASQQIVSISFGGPPIKFRLSESLIQICAHGTHHRAQLLNMLRHSGLTPPPLDYVLHVPDSDPV